MSIKQVMEEYRVQEKGLRWTGTFDDYFNMVVANPKLARLSHARMYDMIVGDGYTECDGARSYNFFADDLYGVDKILQKLTDEYFGSAAKRMETRKRILLFMGPVGGGKSTIVTLLKRGLERYTKTDEGAVYAIKGCPMHEEPLHLIPEELRLKMLEEHGLYIEGDLCPHCRLALVEEYDGRVEDVPVERIVFSEKNRVGIGTFSPSDPKSQDVSELTGSLNLATIGDYGTESDPRAYRFDGELNIANRGAMEFIEMLKVDEKFLYGLLTLAQEQNIKTGRFAMIYADEVVLSHTNENEFNAFASNKRGEAMHDRMVVVKVPYNLRLSEEVKIYEKLIRQSGISGVHIAPNTLKVASMFAILTRLEESKKAGMTPLKKLKLYNGEDVDGYTATSLKELTDETTREGMDGLSPRYVINCLSSAVSGGAACVSPIDAMRALRDGLDHHMGINREYKEKCIALLAETRTEFDDWAKTEVQRAFVHSFDDSARNYMTNYLDNIEAYCQQTKLKDPITGDDIEPDEKLMRSIEEQIGISDGAKKMFREEVLIHISAMLRKGKKVDYNDHARLKDAIEKKLFSDMKDIVKITTSSKNPDPEQQKRVADVVDKLISDHGYCRECANALLQYVGTLLGR